MTARVRSFAVIGERVDVWPVAAMLARQSCDDVSIAVCEEPGLGEEVAAIPLADPFFAALNIDAVQLAEAGAGFALGYELEGFAGEGSRIVAAPSGELPAIGGLAFHHILRRVASEAGALDRFADLYGGFRFCARAAAEDRMAFPGDGPESPLAMLGPLAVIDRARLADLLEDSVSPGRVSKVAGFDADFVIDLRRGLALDDGIDLSAVSASRIAADLKPGAMPRYRCAGNGREPRLALREPWQGDRLRMGPASASLGPLFSADVRLLLSQVVHLMECLPTGAGTSAEARRFNHLHRQSVERFYELAAAPLLLGRPGAFDAPEGLVLRIEQFRSRGTVPGFDGEVADRQFWIDLMLSFGVLPERHDRRADAFDPRRLDQALGAIRAQLDQTLARMMPYSDFMRRFRNNRS